MDQYVVIGHPVSHSKSPAIHAAFARQTGQDLTYQTLQAPLDGFAASVAQLRARGVKGANVTVPFKLEACALADQLTARAAAAGAVNTLSFSPAGVVGDNTDGVGLVTDIVANAGIVITGKRILLLGAGGAARGALLPLLAQGPAQLVIANRRLATAQELLQLAQQFSPGSALEARQLDNLEGRFDLIINATSASLNGSMPTLAASLFAGAELAYDMMYAAVPSAFLCFASQCGVPARDGLGMLVEQAAEAFLLWRGVRPQTAAVLAQMRAELNRTVAA
ncbi:MULTISPECIES: shikimate dehydrogenase [unclassified Undibacterium]|uniref:shikimate dehydrogenase n=1 Tax=unclassified Undibacterium TaxID=2630295 RepID=UPI002AC8F3D8|nr:MULTISPECIES: shikimate dehydrogenase [unclassified Undibacterium]MEB0140443.1 shikimate dehydrogenase [Undibacterium sp. CCC2.1]MEB0173548.1 shikimate dehydrogenase [Undibacterium sp. CCC1.1]MEB0177474.1 shikimate dehydrogenase [Undibacterium sp. CCC3.4]MEB0214336.1 shikimate dehydrogenase [Undibacterium sp. 5I2]WPX45582.1 shikimate dehydrogenase [Undibacterium sp. CCC3.4]